MGDMFTIFVDFMSFRRLYVHISTFVAMECTL